MSSKQCPTHEELKTYAQRMLPVEQAEELTKHIAKCVDCEETVQEIASASSNHLVALIKASETPQPFVDEPACIKVVETVKRNAPPTAGQSPQIAAAGNNPPPADPKAARTMNRNEFVEFITTIGFVSAGEVTNIDKQLPAEKAGDVQALAQALVQQGKLTKFQAAAVYQGKGKALVYGDYLVLDRLGAGGMGQVFKARHRRLDRIVALKVLSPAAMRNADSVKRFEREARAAAKLIHPNIVHTYDAGAQDNVHYLVMELVSGPDLSSLVKKQGKLDVKLACDYIAQAARGFAFAHSKGIVHRDIKPGNLLVDQDGTVKVLDMGLARFDDAGLSGGMGEAELTQSGAVMGTVDYMAPEQALNTSRADAKSDVYGLGCTLYRILTGESVYAGDTLMEKLLAHREKPVPELRRVRPDAPQALEALIARMLSKQPDQRPTMQEVADALPGTLEPGIAVQPMQVRAPAVAVAGVPTMVAAQPKPRGAVPPKGRGKLPLFAAAGAGGLLILGGILFVIRDKDGNKIAEVNAPDGSSVAVQAAPPPVVATPPIAATTTVTATGPASTAQTPRSIFTSTSPAVPEATAVATKPTTNTAAPIAPPSGGIPSRAVAPFDAAQAKSLQAGWAAFLGQQEVVENAAGMKLVLIPAGEFPMGATHGQQQTVIKAAANDHEKGLVANEVPQHRVVLRSAYRIGATEVTIGEFRRFVEATKYVTECEEPANADPSDVGRIWNNPGYPVTDQHPVTCVTWNDAVAFCNWLSESEGLTTAYKREGKWSWSVGTTVNGYRLPTEAEWEFACRAGTTTQFWFGESFDDIPVHAVADKGVAVATKPANPFGLFDTSGNIQEWCQDLYSQKPYDVGTAEDPTGSATGGYRILRGGSWREPRLTFRSTYRGGYPAKSRNFHSGFRVVKVIGATKPATAVAVATPAPLPSTVNVAMPGATARAVAPFDAAQAKSLQEAWAAALKLRVIQEIHVGMRLALIPAGEFMMGSTPEQQAAAFKGTTDAKYEKQFVDAEGPQHRVVLRSPYRIGIGEVTIREFRFFVEATKYVTECEDPANALASDGTNTWRSPGYPVTDHSPVTCVTWNDACAFCNWLCEKDGLQQAYRNEGPWKWSVGTTSNGYRLPTEAEWEFACRAGTTTQFWFGDDFAKIPDFAVTKPGTWVGSKPANPFGIHDTSGNVWEFCNHNNKPYEAGTAEDPTGPSVGGSRAVRGGSWRNQPITFRSAYRVGFSPNTRNNYTGFRIVRMLGAAPPAATVAVTTTTAPTTTPTSLPAATPAAVDPAATSSRSSPTEILAFDFDPLPQELTVGQSPTMEFRATNSKSQEFPLTGTYHHSDLAAFKPVAAVQVRLQCLEPGPDALLAATDWKKAPMTAAGIVVGAPRISSTNQTLTSGETVKGSLPLRISALPVGKYVMTVTCVPTAGLGRNQYGSYEFRIVDQPAATPKAAQVTWSFAPPALLATAPRLLPITDPERRAVLWALPLAGKMQITHQGLAVGPNPLPDDAFTLRNIDFLEAANNNESRKMIIDADLENLVGLKEIKQLRLNYAQITDSGLKHLAGLTTLLELNLSDTKIGDAGIAKLAALKEVRSLRLNGTGITDAGLQKIVEIFPMVSEPLEVNDTRVTDAGVAHLRNATYVRYVGLAGTDVTDACVPDLVAIQRLARVNLIGTRVTEAGIAKLKAMLAGRTVEIGFDPAKVKTGPRTTPIVNVPFASTAPTAPAAATPSSTPAGEPPAAPAGPSRLAVPDAKAQQTALQLIKEVYKDDYAAARVPDKKAELAEKLLEQSTQTTDPTDRYVLLNEARTFASDGDDQALLRRVLTVIVTDFDVDTVTIYIDSWKGVLAKPRPAAVAKGIYDEITAMFESAVAQGAFDEAKRFGDYALTVAPRIGDATAVKSTRDRNTLLAARQQEWNAARAALAKLAANPDDPEANLAVGRFRAHVEADWPNAFSQLAKSSDATWKDLATKSITVAADGNARATLADGFWDASTKAKGPAKAEFAAAALYWYQAALPSLSGLQKVRIEKRITEATAAVPAKKLPPTTLEGGPANPLSGAAPSAPTGAIFPTGATTTPAAATPATAAGLPPDDPRGPFGNAAYQKWMKEVQALPIAEQMPAVSKKMKELNPDFDGVIRSRVRDGFIYDIGFSGDNVTNIYPLRALARLEEINCGASSPQCKLTDLTPLTGMKLKTFQCAGVPVSDLSPLRGMPLEILSVSKTQVADISVLAGMPLKTLNIDSTQVFDLSPLQNCKQLTDLTRVGSRVQPAMIEALKQVLPNCVIR